MDPRARGGGAQDKEIPFPPSGSERVTAEIPVTASGKHESVLARGGGMGAQHRELVLCFSLIYTFPGGRGGGVQSSVSGGSGQSRRLSRAVMGSRSC